MMLGFTTTGTNMVVLTRDEYDRLTAALEDAGDAALIDAARAADAGAPTLPADLAQAVLADELHPLTAWRNAAGLSMAALAKAAGGIRIATISDIENGKLDPRWSTVKALADALGVDADDIMR